MAELTQKKEENICSLILKEIVKCTSAGKLVYLKNKYENKKLYLVYLNAQNNYNPSLLYKSLINESENDIDFGLQLLGYE